jgi:hypothetical protein
VPALVALALVAAVWVAFHAYEIIWWREACAQTRAMRAPVSAYLEIVALALNEP